MMILAYNFGFCQTIHAEIGHLLEERKFIPQPKRELPREFYLNNYNKVKTIRSDSRFKLYNSLNPFENFEIDFSHYKNYNYSGGKLSEEKLNGRVLKKYFYFNDKLSLIESYGYDNDYKYLYNRFFLRKTHEPNDFSGLNSKYSKTTKHKNEEYFISNENNLGYVGYIYDLQNKKYTLKYTETKKKILNNKTVIESIKLEKDGKVILDLVYNYIQSGIFLFVNIIDRKNQRYGISKIYNLNYQLIEQGIYDLTKSKDDGTKFYLIFNELLRDQNYTKIYEYYNVFETQKGHEKRFIKYENSKFKNEINYYVSQPYLKNEKLLSDLTLDLIKNQPLYEIVYKDSGKSYKIDYQYEKDNFGEINKIEGILTSPNENSNFTSLIYLYRLESE